jgi:hypothetical protein
LEAAEPIVASDATGNSGLGDTEGVEVLVGGGVSLLSVAEVLGDVDWVDCVADVD